MKKISLAIMTLLVALSACKKVPEVNLKYVDVERDLITVGTTTATIQCDYEYIATLKKAFLNYCEGTDTINMSIAEMSVVQKTLYVELSGLKENTTYSYYYEFANGFNSMRSAAKTFKTEASPVIPPEITLPTIVTAEVTEITTNSAQCGGEVTNDGGAEVTERGICWSTNANPSLNDSHIASGTGTGAFIAMMNSLEANTTYHVRAYATNEKGTAYGLDGEFTTPVYVPEGAINGLFTINENGDQVYFSQGNLQYQASTNNWRFAENQWNYVGTQIPDDAGYMGGNVNGSDNHLISSTYSGWIDLFGWGTSGWNNGNVRYQPYDTEMSWPHGGYGPCDGMNYEYDLTGTYANADWGVYNAVANGGNVSNLWRTLIRSEWVYVFYDRTTTSGIRFAKGIVNGVNGVILLPDDWSASLYTLNSTNSIGVPYSVNEIILADWRTMEANGVVFLPAAGYRNGTLIGAVDFATGYWSASCGNASRAYGMQMSDGGLGMDFSNRSTGLCVRLVQDAHK